MYSAVRQPFEQLKLQVLFIKGKRIMTGVNMADCYWSVCVHVHVYTVVHVIG